MLHKKIISNKMIYRYYNKPSFIGGIASLFDLYNAKPCQKIYLSNSKDFKEIGNDFRATGLSIQGAIDNYSLKMAQLTKKKH